MRDARRVRSLLAPGDVIVTRDFYIGRLVPGYWSHAAVYVGSVGGVQSVVQARAQGVHALSLGKLFRTQYLAVLRPRVPVYLRRSAARHALSLCGREFDFQFDFGDEHKLSCAEIPYLLYKKDLHLTTQRVNVAGLQREVFLPDNFFHRGFDVRWVSAGTWSVTP